MHAKDLIKLNNEKRELLNIENRQDYEDMLEYIRMHHNKSEQQTEELLIELLDHLLDAQDQGKSAKDIFGDDLKAYCQELIIELPVERISINLMFISYLVLNLLGLIGMFVGIVDFILYQFVGIGEQTFNFSLGSGIVIIIIDFLILALFVYVVFLWINGSLFKNKKAKKWLEFIQIWFICTLFIVLSVGVLHFMPAFGMPVSIPHLAIIAVGAILYLSSMLLNKKYRITK